MARLSARVEGLAPPTAARSSVPIEHAPDRVILEAVDPTDLTPGGIDTCIHDLVKFGTGVTFAIVGAATVRNKFPLGEWQDVTFAGRRIAFLPVINLDRSNQKRIIPHSLRLALGCLRYRKRIPRGLVQTHRIELGLFALIALRCARLAQFLHTEGPRQYSKDSDSLWRRLGSTYHWLEAWVLKRAAEVVLFSAADAERVRAIVPDLTVSRTWFDPETFSPSEITQNADLVLWVGRLEAVKDPALAVEAFALLKARYPTLKLEMIGTGTLLSTVRSLIHELKIEDAVSLPGRLSRTEVAQRMRSARVLVMTSRFEGSPRVLIEAGATGLPVAAVFSADPDCAIVDGVNGAVAQAATAVSVASAAERALLCSRRKCRDSVEHLDGRYVVARLLGQPDPRAWPVRTSLSDLQGSL